jgi:hypothetical protein
VKITKSQLRQIVKEELKVVVNEGVAREVYQSTLGDREQRAMKRWWLAKLKDPEAEGVQKPGIEAKIKAGIFGIDQYAGGLRLMKNFEDRLRAYKRTSIPVIDSDFRVRGDKIMLADTRGGFLDVSEESWVPESISSKITGRTTDIDLDGDTDAEDVLQVAQAAAETEEPENISEGSRKMRITKKQLKQMVRKELASVEIEARAV